VGILKRVPLLLMMTGVVGCATPAAPMTLADRLQNEQRLLEVACVRQLLDQGVSLMHHAEAVTNHCRRQAKLNAGRGLR
jgi:hypothetical protein